MREAQDWVVRLTSGEATAEVAEALQRWRKKSREHRRAFAEANLMWDRLHAAATQSKAKQQLAAERRAAANGASSDARMFFRRHGCQWRGRCSLRRGKASASSVAFFSRGHGPTIVLTSVSSSSSSSSMMFH